MPFQKRFQALPHNWVVINQQYANCHSISVLLGRPDDSPHCIYTFVTSLTKIISRLNTTKIGGGGPLNPLRLTFRRTGSNTGNPVFRDYGVKTGQSKRCGWRQCQGNTFYRAIKHRLLRRLIQCPASRRLPGPLPDEPLQPAGSKDVTSPSE